MHVILFAACIIVFYMINVAFVSCLWTSARLSAAVFNYNSSVSWLFARIIVLYLILKQYLTVLECFKSHHSICFFVTKLCLHSENVRIQIKSLSRLDRENHCLLMHVIFQDNMLSLSAIFVVGREYTDDLSIVVKILVADRSQLDF